MLLRFFGNYHHCSGDYAQSDQAQVNEGCNRRQIESSPPPKKTGCSKAKGCTKICKPIFFVAAAPFHLVEKILKKLEKWFVKHVEANEDEDEDGDEEADL